MKPSNKLSKILLEFSIYHTIKGDSFKPRAYEMASESVAALGNEIKQTWQSGGIKALKDLPGIGESIAEKIDEFYRTGKIKTYAKIKKEFPVDMYELSQIEGLGPKHIAELWKYLKVKNINDLKKALANNKLKDLPRWGKKSQDKIARQLKLYEQSSKRMLLGHILPIADDMVDNLSQINDVKRCTYAGSIRRREETCGDIDLIATSNHPQKVINAFCNLPQVKSVHEKGKTKASVRLHMGIDADIRVVKDEVYGATLQYFTGNKRHNVLLRQHAQKKGFTLSEYGLFKLKRSDIGRKTSDVGRNLVACKTEEQIYSKLGMDTPPPELRIGEDELEAAKKHKLPKLLPYGSIRGDLQVQSNWSDGSASIEELARAAKKQRLDYIAITDHTKSLTIAGGLDEKRLARQGKEIDKLNKKLRSFKILKGTECDILKDGKLDLSDTALAKLDFVGISVHSQFGLSEKDQTTRVIKAMSNPHVHCLFHPTCRLIGKREAIKLNMDEIIAAAKKYHVLLEINSMPERMDLNDRWVRAAINAKVKLVINTDAHSPDHFTLLQLGESTARRGWATKKDILNTKSAEQLLSWLNK
ncbi:MAG: DNA polymerase/3'-5' exonuclease PolX [Patescibacteria group bacterium]|nr:DNA polymerase/3'-5' exonuclease PolX [Patescibacteria group bacterium]